MPDIKTQGTELQIDTDGTPTWTKVGGVASISGLGGGEAADIDTTDFDSTAKEFVQGLPDEGVITVTGNFDPDDAQQTLMQTRRASQASADFRAVLPDSGSTTFSFTAFVKSFEKSIEADDAVRFTATLRITGSIVES